MSASLRRGHQAVKPTGKQRGAATARRTSKAGEIARSSPAARAGAISAGEHSAQSDLPTSAPAVAASQPARAIATFAAPVEALEKAKAFARAEMTIKSSDNAALVVRPFAKGSFGEQNLWALSEGLKDSIAQVHAGDMRQCEAMLMGQAVALQSIFTNMAQRVLNQEFLQRSERLFSMAMKAQNQCRMTLETLNELKHPRQSTFVRAGQANIATGPQQVNNGPATDEPTRARAREIESEPSKLLEQQNAERLECGTAGSTGSADSPVAAVASINRTGDGQG
jgi:hypothetical protein